MIAIYAGPTISHNEIMQTIDCICLPPVSHGDILKLLPRKPEAIGIIDGYFEGAPSVWHKEILYALDQGVHVIGSSSMGALRAAELYTFGMAGIGQIFQWYRDGVVEDDDEVAVLHGPEEASFTVASEPMVNIRATLELAHQQQVINEVEKEALIELAKNTFYKKRTWKRLLESSVELFADKSLASNLKNWLQQNRIDLKKQDAIKMLEFMQQNRESYSNKPEINFHFEWTNAWDAAFNEHSQPPASTQCHGDNDQNVLDQLRLDPDRYQRYRDKALLTWLCDNRVEIPASDSGVKVALKQFRQNNQLASRSQLLDYMDEVDWDEAELTVLLQKVSRVNYTSEIAGDLTPRIVDQLKLDGNYIHLLAVSNRKQAAIHSAGLDSDHPAILPPELLAWYFERQLSRQIPQRLEDHLIMIDTVNSEDFYHLISEDYLYWGMNH